MKPISIVNRLTIWFSLSLFLIVLVATGYLYWSNTRAMTSEEHAIVQDRLQAIQALLQGPDPIQSLRRRVQTEWASRHFERFYIRILDAQGKSMLETPGIPDEVPTQVFSMDQGAEPGAPGPRIMRVTTLNGAEYLTIFHRMTGAASDDRFSIQIALDLEPEQKIQSAYQGKLVAVLLLSFIVAILIGRSLAMAGFSPVRRMIETARLISSSNLDQRITEEELPPELKTLGRTINQMLARLEESFERLSRFSSDIAHELRTPINNMRGEMEVALQRSRTPAEYRTALGSALEETDRLAKIIDALLFLAKVENAPTALRKEDADLKLELEKIIEFYEAPAADMGIELRLEVPAGLRIDVERTLFQRAVANVLSNSLNYTGKDGHVVVRAQTSAGHVLISVEDTGEGIKEEDLPKVFDRFYRADESRSTTKLGGFGLGLTIVKSIVALHGGEVSIDSLRGRGTIVRMTFPSRAAS